MQDIVWITIGVTSNYCVLIINQFEEQLMMPLENLIVSRTEGSGPQAVDTDGGGAGRATSGASAISKKTWM